MESDIDVFHAALLEQERKANEKDQEILKFRVQELLFLDELFLTNSNYSWKDAIS